MRNRAYIESQAALIIYKEAADENDLPLAFSSLPDREILCYLKGNYLMSSPARMIYMR